MNLATSHRGSSPVARNQRNSGVIITAVAVVLLVLGIVWSTTHRHHSSVKPAANTSVASVNLNGNWKDDVHKFYGTVENNTMTITYSVGPDETSLYWAGSFNASTARNNVVTSTNDKDKTAMVLYASGADTKDFTYKDGQLWFSFSALGQTETIKMKRG